MRHYIHYITLIHSVCLKERMQEWLSKMNVWTVWRYCSYIYRESYSFIRNYIYIHNGYTRDLQIIQGNIVFWLQHSGLTPSSYIVFLCCYDEASFVAPPTFRIKGALSRSYCNAWQDVDNQWLTVFLRTFERRRPLIVTHYILGQRKYVYVVRWWES